MGKLYFFVWNFFTHFSTLTFFDVQSKKLNLFFNYTKFISYLQYTMKSFARLFETCDLPFVVAFDYKGLSEMEISDLEQSVADSLGEKKHTCDRNTVKKVLVVKFNREAPEPVASAVARAVTPVSKKTSTKKTVKKEKVDTETPMKFEREEMTPLSWLDTGKLPSKLITNEDQFQVLWDLHPETHHEVLIYGELRPIPRWQQSYLRDYKFSGAELKTLPLPDEFKPYMTWANSLGYGKFNSFLVNWYEDGEHYIGAHADSTVQLVPDSPIITITLCLPGQPRKFRLRDMEKNIVKDVLTPNGVVLVMGGRFQKEFKHEIVKIAGAAAKKAGSRISITLRQFK